MLARRIATVGRVAADRNRRDDLAKAGSMLDGSRCPSGWGATFRAFGGLEGVRGGGHRMRARLAGVGVGAAATALLGAVTLVGSGPAGAVAQTQAFSFTGGAQTFTVPANVCRVTV